MEEFIFYRIVTLNYRQLGVVPDLSVPWEFRLKWRNRNFKKLLDYLEETIKNINFAPAIM